jgi:hypothetical protein
LPRDGFGERPGHRLRIRHPGGLGQILHVADGGSWLRGVIEGPVEASSDIEYVAIA